MRESVLCYFVPCWDRELNLRLKELMDNVSRSWGLASLMQALKETSEANRGRMRLAYQDRSVQRRGGEKAGQARVSQLT